MEEISAMVNTVNDLENVTPAAAAFVTFCATTTPEIGASKPHQIPCEPSERGAALTDNRLLFTGKAAAHIADAGHPHNEQPVTLSDESGAGMYHGSDTRVGEGYGAYWKFSAIVRELCRAPCWADHNVRPSREAARFGAVGAGSSNWSTDVSRCVLKS